MKCFYHGIDLDGKMSGAIVKSFEPDCEMFPINYGDIFPWGSINQDEEVYIVDFSLQPFDKMEKLAEKCQLTWIDHHEVALEDANKTGIHDKLAGSNLEVGIGACQLVYEYFTDFKVPLPIQMLARYDVWDHNWIDKGKELRPGDVLSFQYGIQANLPTDSAKQINYLIGFISQFSRKSLETEIHEGEAILKYIKANNAEYAKSHAFKTSINETPAIAINKGLASSLLFDSVSDPDFPISIAYCQMPNGRWTVSLYSTTIHVGNIAKSFGGGGHEQAAGFQCDSLPFKPI